MANIKDRAKHINVLNIDQPILTQNTFSPNILKNSLNVTSGAGSTNGLPYALAQIAQTASTIASASIG